MVNRYWFRPKRVGYGATPTTWEGWLLTLGSLAVIGGASLAMVVASKSAVLSEQAMFGLLRVMAGCGGCGGRGFARGEPAAHRRRMALALALEWARR